jgi:hypothetical protein
LTTCFIKEYLLCTQLNEAGLCLLTSLGGHELAWVYQNAEKSSVALACLLP